MREVSNEKINVLRSKLVLHMKFLEGTVLSGNVFGRFVGQLLNDVLERHEFLLLHQTEFLDEKRKMLERGVEMWLHAQRDDILEVLMVNMGVDAEEPFEDSLGVGEKILGKRHADFRREHHLVIQLNLHPRHQVINILQKRWKNHDTPTKKRSIIHGLKKSQSINQSIDDQAAQSTESNQSINQPTKPTDTTLTTQSLNQSTN